MFFGILCRLNLAAGWGFFLCNAMTKSEIVSDSDKVFDYGDMKPADIKSLESHAGEIEEIQNQARRITAEAVILQGKQFKAVHDLLKGRGRDGLFRPWVKQRCGLTPMSVYRIMAACDAFEKCNKLLHLFDASALYLLSAESCPEDVTEEAIRLAEAGERITHKRAKELKEGSNSDDDDDDEQEFDAYVEVDKAEKAIRRMFHKWPDDMRDLIPQVFQTLSQEEFDTW